MTHYLDPTGAVYCGAVLGPDDTPDTIDSPLPAHEVCRECDRLASA
jgi:hypothetical protein